MDEKLNNEHDLGYKSIFSLKKNFIEFLRGFVKKDWSNLINEDNLVLIDKQFILEDFKEEEADIVYKVNIDGKDVIFYILLELQSKVDFRMPIRLLMYMTEIWRDELKNKEDKIKKKKDYRLPAIVPIVLYNGKNKWTAARNFKEILNGYQLFEDSVVDFKYLLFDINRMDKQELLDIANVVSSVFLLDQDVEKNEIMRRLKLIGKIIRKGTSKEQEKVFKGWLINVLKNRVDKEKQSYIYKVLEEISKVEGDDMVSNLGRNIEKAFKEARQEGMQEGVQEARIEMAMEMISQGEDNKKIVKYTKLSEKVINELRTKK